MTGRYTRNEALFGADGQAKIGETRAAIVGLGGLGSHLAQQLAYLGVNEYVLVDFDVVTDSSLNRLIGAVDEDVAAGTKKVAVAARVIKSVNPAATVTLVEAPLVDRRSVEGIAAAEVVFGCVDRDIHRLELTEITSRHARPYFDLATDIHGRDRELAWGGRVVFCDGSRCLVCLPEILDQDAIAFDRLDPEQRDADRRIYGVDREALGATGPSVVSVNGVVASLAVTEFMVWVTGLREPASQPIYVAGRGIVRVSKDQPAPGCYYCTGLWGTAV